MNEDLSSLNCSVTLLQLYKNVQHAGHCNKINRDLGKTNPGGFLLINFVVFSDSRVSIARNIPAFTSQNRVL